MTLVHLLNWQCRFHIALMLFIFIFSNGYSQCPPPLSGTEAVKNGGFENGNDGTSTFGPHLNFETSGKPYSDPGYYDINGDPLHFNKGFAKSFPPHSGNYMLMVDAAQLPQAIFWEQTIAVTSNQFYYFSAWLTSLSSGETSKLRFEVKGNLDAGWSVLGNEVAAPAAGVWQQVIQTWPAGNNTSVSIRLSDNNPTGYSNYGNDFAVDDISFTNSCKGLDLGPKPDLTPSTISLCNNGGSVDLDSKLQNKAPTTFSWYKDNVLVAAQNAPVYTNVTTVGAYTVCVDSSTCQHQATVNVVASLTIDIGPNTMLCKPATKLLQTGITVPGNFNIIWKKDGVVITDSTGNTSFVASEKGVYSVDVTEKSGGTACQASSSVTLTSNLPVPGNFTFCSKTAPNQTFAVTGSGTYTWWDAATGGTQVGSGPSYNATGLTGSKTYYAQDETTSPASAGISDPSVLAGAQKGPNNVAAQTMIKFTAKATSKLDAVSVYMNFVNAASPAVLITLTDNTTSAVQSQNIAFANPGNGDFLIPANLGFNIKAGDNYTITAVGNNGACQTYRYSTQISYPMVYGPMDFSAGQGNADMAAIFNFKISLPNACARMPVTGTEQCPLNCVMPAGIALSPPGPLNSCTGTAISQVLTATITNSNAANFMYEFFKNGVSVQAASATTTYTVTQAGNYTVKVTDQANPGSCKVTSQVVKFIVNPLPSLTETHTDACSGKNNGTATIVINNGLAGTYNIKWDDVAASTTATISNLPAGTYTATVQDGNNCQASIKSTIALVSVVASATATDVSCNGGSDGTVTGSGSGGTGPYTYSSDGTNFVASNVFKNLTKNTYTVYVKDKNGCTDQKPAIVNEPATKVSGITSNVKDVDCFGNATGRFDLTPSGGTGPYTLFLDGASAAATSPFTNLVQKTYNVKIFDAKNCTTDVVQVIKEPTAVSLSGTKTDETCLAKGAIQALASGGNSPYTYSIDQWTSSQTSGAFNNLSAGNYTISAKDVANCPAKPDLPVTILNSSSFQPVITGPSAFCSGAKIGLSVKDSTGIVSYNWLPGNATTATLSVIKSGAYTVQVKDKNGCLSQVSAPFTVKETLPPNPEIGVDSLLICSKGDALLGNAADPSATYQWTSVPAGFTSTEANPKVNPEALATYIRTSLSGTCKTSDTVVVKIYPPSFLYLPNAFTPNQDGLNEKFDLTLSGITFNCGIYNRWGELLYEWTEPLKGWDGTYMNHPVHDDVYVYKLKYKERCSNSNIDRTGIVTVMGK